MRSSFRAAGLRRFLILGVATTLALTAATAPSQADKGNRQDKGDKNEQDGKDSKNRDDDRESDNRDEDEKREDEKRNAGIACASDKTRPYSIKDTSLPFDALPGTAATQKWGVIKGAGYRIEVPKNWNGELVMWAHGFRNWDCDLTIDNPPMRQYLLDNGYAWAASSYAANGYAIQQGVDDTMRLVKFFKRAIKRPHRTYITGASMGGHITGVAIEQNRNAFDGAMPVCGVMGSEKLFDYFLDYNELAQSISGVTTPYPYGVDYVPVVVPQIQAGLGGPTSAKTAAFAGAVMNVTGGARPGFIQSFSLWGAFPFNLAQPNPGVVPAFPATNISTQYQIDADPGVSAAEAALNGNIRRVSRLDFATPDGTVPIPKIEGNFKIPVLTMHTLGDLFVPFSMEQIYARRAAANGNSGKLVQRAIRDVFHCTFAEAEYNQSFADLAAWVKLGVKPAGDDILNPAVVAQPTFGCTFSKNSGGFLGSPARGVFTPC
jgi:Prolyl oligopeptidase family